MVSSTRNMQSKLMQGGLGQQMDLMVYNARWFSDGSDFCHRVHSILKRSNRIKTIEDISVDTHIEMFVLDRKPRDYEFSHKTKKIVIGRGEYTSSIKKAIDEGAHAYININVDKKEEHDLFLIELEQCAEELNDENSIDPILKQVQKTAQSAELLDAIFDRKDKIINDCPLSDVERELLVAVADGFTDKEIVGRNSSSFKLQTIKNRLMAIRRKMNATSRTHAVAIALRKDWIK